ncbi:unnamed protein product [Ilex paraguariensis]|uniref:Uncharacterized protein n=1 Tax=Ilex paraguariensis TaxID=185542 RepID=A0ABC8QSB6_9AQUA
MVSASTVSIGQLFSQNSVDEIVTNDQFNLQAMACSRKIPNRKHPTPTILLPKGISYGANPQEMPFLTKFVCKTPFFFLQLLGTVDCCQ